MIEPCRAADAIMGVSFFRETAPEDFATFDRSFYAMCARVKCEPRVGYAQL